MKIETLVKMANDIGNFFNAESNKDIAAEGVSKHILRSWHPKMRREIIAYCKEDGSALSELARTAINKLDQA
ncbi:formate dehydrogenase subunit delta [Methylobacter psychrophilus]|uniref:formate dehydrogenase subunit delta n=1 Tax=Methylobacter psychrophilus TaxID=96941 RepID=UPI0021D4F09E|nr:formate dehydrogenase subunit delta [Methylobacter psychrophilus]